MVSRTQLNQLNLTQQQAVRLAIAEMRKLWTTLNELTPEWQHDLLLDAIPQLAARYGDIAGTAAAEWYEATRLENTGAAFDALTYGSFNPDAIKGSIDAKAYPMILSGNPQQAFGFLTGAMQRWIRYVGRQTIARNCQHDPFKPRWARVPSGAKTCAWCEMLCSRGFVYYSKETAGALAHWHDECDCSIVPEWEKDDTHIAGYDPDLYYSRYKAAWDAAGGYGATAAQVTHWMRVLNPGAYTDNA